MIAHTCRETRGGRYSRPTVCPRVDSGTNYHRGSAYIAAKVGGLDSLLLVDSGATLSVISKQVWLTIMKGGVMVISTYRVMERITEVLYRVVPVEGGTEVILHFYRLKPFLAPVSDSEHQEDTRRQQTVPRHLAAGGNTDWVRWRASGSAGRSGNGEVPWPAHPGPESTPAPIQVVREGQRQTGAITSSIQQPAHPVVERAATTSNHGARGGERLTRGSAPQETLLAPSQVAGEAERSRGQQTLWEGRQGQQRRPPLWYRDYEMF